MMVYFSLAGVFSLMSVAFTCVLMDVDRPFYWYKKLLQKMDIDILGKPLGLCEVCFSGQVSMWTFFLFVTDYDIVGHVVVILMTIVFTDLITKRFYS